MFDTTKEDLKDILRKAHEGALQLPDFQRDYVWGEEDVRSLIASVAKGFPVGALLTLETGGGINFKPRILEGVPATTRAPAELLLDGQQRMTSLYQATYSQAPVQTLTLRKTQVTRFFYLDIRKCVASDGADLEEAVVAVPADRVIRKNFGRDVVLDLSSRDAEYEHHHFPLNHVFDSRDWFYGWRDHWRAQGRDLSDLERPFVRGVLECIERYKMPVIRLDNKNSRAAICLVFEKVNVGGKKLDAFELLTAIYASDSFDLRRDWSGGPSEFGRRKKMLGSPNVRDVLMEIASSDFLQACTLLHTRERRLAALEQGKRDKELPQVNCNRDSLLALPLEGYRKHADAIEEGFVEASAFLNEQKIVWHRDVPYPPAIVGLASVFAVLGRDAQKAAAKQKLSQWFWAVTMGELYGSGTETRLGRDVLELVDWIKNSGGPPQSIDEALFRRDRLRSLRSRLSAAYKGLHALLMGKGCRDFITGRPADIMTFFQDRIDIHHVFPRAWCIKQKIPPAVFNSIVNKTPLSKRSNISIGGDAPSVYLKRIQDKEGISADTLDDILRSHLIDPAHLRTDNFKAFFEARIGHLADLVGTAMGKPVVDVADASEDEVLLEDDDDLDVDASAGAA